MKQAHVKQHKATARSSAPEPSAATRQNSAHAWQPPSYGLDVPASLYRSRDPESPARPKVSAASVPSIVGDVLRSPGYALDSDVRASVEERFGYRFDHVRVHDDTKADASTRAVGALAYTSGHHVVFRSGHYAPGTRNGDSLLFHELAHVVQGAGSAYPEPTEIEPEGSAQERSANTIAAAAAMGTRSTQPQPVRAPSRRLWRAVRNFVLTFDDGPHAAALETGNNRTERVLDILHDRNIQVGFFIQTGVSFRGASRVGRALVQRMHREGHVVGIHTGGTADHESHNAAEADGRLGGELRSARKYIHEQTGKMTDWVRPPYGRHNEEVDRVYMNLGLRNLLWDIDGDQGQNLSRADLEMRARDGVRAVAGRGWRGTTLSEGIVVLYHDIQQGTSRYLERVIDSISDETQRVSNGADRAAFRRP